MLIKQCKGTTEQDFSDSADVTDVSSDNLITYMSRMTISIYLMAVPNCSVGQLNTHITVHEHY